MNRNFRLKQLSEFKRVRRFGKSYAHPLVVLVVLPDPEKKIHVGVTAGRSVGNAVHRNKAKRMLREVARSLLPRIETGWKLILISRNPILSASLPEIQAAVEQLLTRAKIISNKNGT